MERINQFVFQTRSYETTEFIQSIINYASVQYRKIHPNPILEKNTHVDIFIDRLKTPRLGQPRRGLRNHSAYLPRRNKKKKKKRIAFRI